MNKYLILRRITQITILLLYFSANYYGWKILQGSLSFSLFLQKIPLTDPYALLQMLFAGAAISMDMIIGAVIIALFYGVIGGRAYCSWVCPVNMVTDLAGYLRRKLNIDKDARRYLISRKFRYWAFATLLIVSFATGVAAFEFISPIGILTRGIVFGIGFGWVFILAIFLFDLFVIKNGWCGHMCPLGAMYSVIGSKSIIRVKHDADACTNCGECKKVCPEKDVLNPIIHKKSDFISGIECTNCGRCIEVCNDNALKFSIRNFIKGDNDEKVTN
ncbi:MAG: quinol dehydrogenase ferredoxin subunit NapH [Epsilonproteobacteria bacterium]|nr:quinol dehydrogenase ferredoxin subunit NapH [Campylobacterota bacterium]